MGVGFDGWGQNSYTSTSATGTWNTARWNNSTDGPTYESTYTANNNVIFTSGNYSFAGMGAAINVGNITLSENVNVTFTANANTFATNATIRTITVGNSSKIDFSNQAFSTSASTGFIKNGSGVLALAGNTYGGGFTLNAGTVVIRGVNAMGDGGTLTINGGTLTNINSSVKDLSDKYDGGIVIGGNFTLGDIVNFPEGSGGLLFNNLVSLGDNQTRSITIGSGSTFTFISAITGNNSNLIINSTSSGKITLTGENTYSGSTTINGGTLQLSKIGGTTLPSNNHTIVNDGGILNITTSQSFQSLLIASGGHVIVDLGADLLINSGNVITIQSGGKLTVTGTLTNNAGASGLVIESDATGTGSLIHSTAGVAATAERYLTNYSTVNDNKYHFLSSPVSAQPIRPDFVANSPAANVDFYKFDEPTATWINTKTEANAWNTEFESNFVVGRGYLIAYPSAPETKSFTGGTLNSYPSESPLVINCTNTNSGGWNLIGNPFPSAIDWNLVQASGLGDGMDAALYYYDHDAANYRYYVQLESVGSLGSGSRYIPAMQGFMVHAKTSGTKTVSLHNGFRAHNGQAFYKSQNEINNLLTVKLHANGKTDEAYILYYDEATESFDSKYDAYKLFSYAEGMPQLYTINSDEAMLAINSLPTQSDVKAVVLGYKTSSAGSQSMSFEGLDSFAQPGSLQLEDKLLGFMHTLTNGPYEFLSEAGTVNDRFVLHFGAVGLGEQTTSSKLKAYVLNDLLYFHQNGQAVMEVIDLQGRLLESAVVNGQGLVNRQMNQPAGVYVIRLTGNEGVQTAKVVVK